MKKIRDSCDGNDSNEGQISSQVIVIDPTFSTKSRQVAEAGLFTSSFKDLLAFALVDPKILTFVF